MAGTNDPMDPIDLDAELNSVATDETTGVGLELVDAGDPDDVPYNVNRTLARGQTNRVKVYSIVCGSGATTSFYTLEGGLRLNARFGFYSANGARLGLSAVFYWDGVTGPNVGRSVRVNGYLPAGTKVVRGFWFFGEPGSLTSPVWWKGAGTNC